MVSGVNLEQYHILKYYYVCLTSTNKLKYTILYTLCRSSNHHQIYIPDTHPVLSKKQQKKLMKL